jgi:hypothetical protein
VVAPNCKGVVVSTVSSLTCITFYYFKFKFIILRSYTSFTGRPPGHPTGSYITSVHGTWFFVPWILQWFESPIFTCCAAVSVARQLGLEPNVLSLASGSLASLTVIMPYSTDIASTFPSFTNFSSNLFDPCILTLFLERIKRFFIVYFPPKTWDSLTPHIHVLRSQFSNPSSLDETNVLDVA